MTLNDNKIDYIHLDELVDRSIARLFDACCRAGNNVLDSKILLIIEKLCEDDFIIN